jgi:hypothetical protein
MSIFVKAILHPENTPIVVRRDTITALVCFPPDVNDTSNDSNESNAKGTWDLHVESTSDKKCWTLTYESGWILHNTIN